ncbi:MAG TPA: hypothetical protein VNS19_11450 [Acidimicrobiales bacterium]|nr:hypothetical protein [Acidimicrobiales bacterium]
MKTERRRARWLALALTLSVAFGATTSLTACTPRTWTWKAGKTHGAIVEVTAGRASLGVYRVPRDALHSVYRSLGIRKTQDAIWAVGRPPSFTKTFTYRGRSITISFGTAALRNKAHSLIYDDPADLRGALLDAQANHDCLALTLLSYGKPTSNWTHKQTGCQMGSLP